VPTSESMIPRPCFQALHTVYLLFCYLFACCHFYSILHLLLRIIYTTCISLSLRRTSAPIHLTSVLGVLGTQETFCIVIAGLFERDSFDLFLPVFDKPWVIHLRETCFCSINLCTWRPNTVYKNRRVCRHHPLPSWLHGSPPPWRWDPWRRRKRGSGGCKFVGGGVSHELGFVPLYSLLDSRLPILGRNRAGLSRPSGLGIR
jgi:hypothetical protein